MVVMRMLGGFRVVDVESGTVISKLRGHRDGKRLMSGSWNKSMTVWDTETADALLTFRGHDAGIHGFMITPDGHELLSVGHDGTVRRWPTQQ